MKRGESDAQIVAREGERLLILKSGLRPAKAAAASEPVTKVTKEVDLLPAYVYGKVRYGANDDRYTVR
jgi:hypothetical protein